MAVKPYEFRVGDWIQCYRKWGRVTAIFDNLGMVLLEGWNGFKTSTFTFSQLEFSSKTRKGRGEGSPQSLS